MKNALLYHQILLTNSVRKWIEISDKNLVGTLTTGEKIKLTNRQISMTSSERAVS